MTKSTDTVHPFTDSKNGWHETGLTKREYFAALAMQGLLANPAVDMLETTAAKAVKIADHLIAELNK